MFALSVVQMTTDAVPSKQRPEPEPDPEGEASVRAFFKRMMPNHPLLQDD